MESDGERSVFDPTSSLPVIDIEGGGEELAFEVAEGRREVSADSRAIEANAFEGSLGGLAEEFLVVHVTT